MANYKNIIRSIDAIDNAIDVGGTADLILVAPDWTCLLYTSPSPRDRTRSRMPSSA